MIRKLFCFVLGHSFKPKTIKDLQKHVTYEITFECETCGKLKGPVVCKPNALEIEKLQYEMWLRHWNQRGDKVKKDADT